MRIGTKQDILKYLQKEDTRLEQLKSYNNKIGNCMSRNCIASVVIPAHNECENICALIDAINSQKFSGQNDITNESFEIIIVDNNSNDNTREKALEYISTTNGNMRIIVISIDFPKHERGVGSARKFGADLALYRAFEEDGCNLKEFYLIGLDADEQIQQGHLETIVKTFRETQADVLLGNCRYNYEAFPKDCELRNIFEGVEKYRQKNAYKELYGGNHALTAYIYSVIQGYPRKSVGEDSYIKDAAEKLNAKISPFHSDILDNPRRMLVNPIEYLTHEAWDEKVFNSRNEDIRNKIVNVYEYKDETIKRGLTVFIDALAGSIAMYSYKQVEDALYEERESFKNALNEVGVRNDVIPDYGLFWMHKLANYTFLRNFKSRSEKLILIEQEAEELRNIIKNVHVFAYGYFAIWVISKNKEKLKVPTIITLATLSDKASDTIKRFEEKEYALFDIIKSGSKSFFKRITPFEIKDVVGKDSLILTKVNSNGIPISRELPLLQIKLHILEKYSNKIKFCHDSLLEVSNKYDEQQFVKEEIPICHEYLLLQYFLEAKDSKKYIKDFLNEMIVSKEKVYDYLNLLDSCQSNCTNYLNIKSILQGYLSDSL